MLIKNVTIYQETDHHFGHLSIENGKIKKIYRDEPSELAQDTLVIDGAGLNLLPGFIDTHIHGAAGADVMDATDEALTKMASYLVSEGTTSFLATTITQSDQQIEAALSAVANFNHQVKQAELIGVHLEGPFVEKAKAGAQPAQYIRKPDLELFNKWQSIAQGKIKTITMAPEHDEDGTFIQALREQGINVSAGHTDASFADMKKAVSVGVNQLTHLCNAMNGIHHRDIGAVGASFLLDQLKAEIIADGIHIDPAMLAIIYQNVGSDRLILITDAMRAKGLPDGDYELGGQPVKVAEGRAVLEDGTLAGSILNMIDGAKHLLQIQGVTLSDIVKMASVNPAKQIGVFERKGSIATGKDADLLLVDDQLNIHYTLCQGKIAYTGV